MKRIFAVLIALALACSALVIVPAAEAPNLVYVVEYTEDAPTVDGEIEVGEYGKYPIDSWAYADGAGEETFTLSNYLITDDEDLEIEFYATWTEDDLYLAWKVVSKYRSLIPLDNMPEGETGDGYMYNYCYVQLLMTPGAPDANVKKYQTAEWSGDYLDIGLCLKDDGQSYKVAWTQPLAANNSLTLSDWEFLGSLDESTGTFIYEVRLPWNKTGIEEKGEGARFGMNWAVGVQEHYTNVQQGIVEWVDGVAGGKNADAAPIIELIGGPGKTKVEIELPDTRDDSPHADLPEGLEESLLQILQLNAAVIAEQISLVADPENINNYNPNYAQTLLLRPLEDNSEEIEGYYEVVENVTGSGAAIAFENDVEDGDVALVVHSDGVETSAGFAARQVAAALAAGDTVYLHGVQWNPNEGEEGKIAWKNCNAQLAIVPNPADQIIGMWGAEDTFVEFKEDGTGTLNGEAFTWEMSEDGELSIDGEVGEWSVEGDVLTLGDVALNRATAGDYTALNAAITTANLLSADNYTEESYAALTAALTAATEVVNAAYTSLNQAEIDAATDALQAAIDALVEVNTGDESSAAVSEEASASTSSTASTATSAATSEDTDDNEGGISPVVIVVIIVVVVAIVAVVVVVVLKKKK